MQFYDIFSYIHIQVNMACSRAMRLLLFGLNASLVHVPHNEAQARVCMAIRAGDMKMLSLAYVSGFIARRLLLIAAVMLAKPV